MTLTLPELIAVLVIVALFVGGSFLLGWWARDRTETTIEHRPMTPEEQAKFNESFEHMDRAFKAMGDAFGERRR